METGVEAGASVEDAESRPVTANIRAFRVLVRNAMFRRVRSRPRTTWTVWLPSSRRTR